MRRAILAAVTMLVVAGCFNPKYPENLPCSEASTCPPNQQCDLATGTCRKELPPITPDARVSEPIDASMADARGRCESREDCQGAGEICQIDQGECVVASCTDNARNGNESDTDCGGPDCPRCPGGSRCETPSDCLNNECTDGRCVSESCGNGQVDSGEDCDDQGESATCNEDCTISACRDGVPNATAGEQCDDGNDSNNDACTNECRLASCSDEFQNADELDVDCGGHCGPRSCSQGQSCGGDTDCDTDLCEQGRCTSPDKLVFVSSVGFNGNMGGLAGADARCQDLAAAAGLPGTYRAWLSTASESPSTRFVQSAGRYRLVNGTVIANNWTDLTDGTIGSAINVTELGTTPPPPSGSLCFGDTIGVWTATQAAGTPITFDSRCQDWTTTSGSSFWGGHTRTNNEWTAWCTGGTCNMLAPIYCFQQ
jgi:hypothetical protein